MTTTPSKALRLKTAIATQGHTAALKDRTISVEGAELEFVDVTPQIAAFRRMVREIEFDVCEMSPTTYLAAKAFNKPFTAIPVFLGRQFHNNALVYNAQSGIQQAKDFEGKRVGVRAYTVATGVWVRGTLQYEYGVDIGKVTWVTDDEEHVSEFRAPVNVIAAPGSKSLIELLLANEIAASFTGAAGVGRAGPPAAGWDRPEGGAAPARIEDSADVKPLVPNVGDVEIERYKRTGIYPIHGVIVVKDSVLQEYPWVGAALFEAFKSAKDAYVTRLNTVGPSSPQDEAAVQRQKVIGGDPLPYGIRQNRSSLEAMITFAHDQKLIPNKFVVEELFAAGTTELE